MSIDILRKWSFRTSEDLENICGILAAQQCEELMAGKGQKSQSAYLAYFKYQVIKN